MGVRKLIDKTIRPMTTVTNLTPALAVAGLAGGQLGNLPIGMYRGAPAFWDLDKAVVQPLVMAEKQHVLGMLGGRLEGYDQVTIAPALGAAIGTVYRGRITVPAGQVWYLSHLEIVVAKDTTAVFDVNWRCSLWPDIVTAPAVPDADGQTYLVSDIVGTNAILFHEFVFGSTPTNPGVTGLAAVNKATATLRTLPTLLRLPAGTVLTSQITVRTNVVILAANLNPIAMAVQGYVGKALV